MCKAKFPHENSTYMSYTMRDALTKQAEKEGISRAALIRKAIRSYLAFEELKEGVNVEICPPGGAGLKYETKAFMPDLNVKQRSE